MFERAVQTQSDVFDHHQRVASMVLPAWPTEGASQDCARMNNQEATTLEQESEAEEENEVARSPAARPGLGGFKSVVRKLQFAAKLSTVAHEDESLDEFRDDVKLTNNTRASILKRSRYQKSRFSSILNRTSKKASSIVSLSSIAKSPITDLSGVNRPSHVYGEIAFSKNDPQQKPFVMVNVQHLPQDEMDHIIKNVWELEMPKIVTLIVSSKSHHQLWSNKKQIKYFQTGIAKAAMSTNMWIVTNGLNAGVTSYISSAIENELRRLKQKQLDKLENVPLVIGICHDHDLVYGQRFASLEQSNNIIWVENVGYAELEDQFQLDPFHSHYVILRSDTLGPKTDKLASSTSTAATIQPMAKAKLDFVMKLLRNETPELGNHCQQQNECEESRVEWNTHQVPLVSILVEGGPEQAVDVLNLVKSGIPVVVLKGSGGLADVLALAYTRIWSAITDVDSWDADYIEDYIKPVLTQKICTQLGVMKNKLLRRNIVCDQIIECVRLSRSSRREYLNILDMFDRNAHQLTNLSELLLKTLLKSSRKRKKTTQKQVLQDFDLIIDWNCASVAKSFLFSHNSLNLTDLFKAKFFASLTRSNREEFVDIFLSHGFQVHKFLTPSRLARLYRCIHEDDFFHSVCWETALGHSDTSKQNKFFIENDLNWLIEFCTGLEAYVSSEELHINSSGMGNALSAERKALILLSFWAVMQNRYKLVEVIWKHGDHPVHHALVISMFFERLSWHVLDTNLKAELKNRCKQFADYANGVLDRCYIDNITQAYNVLKESTKDWNYLTAVDIAANAQLRQFLAHPCCQKWLTNTYYGHIRLRQLAWGIFTMPNMLKILLSSIFILPMFVWIRFKDFEDMQTSRELDNRDNEDEIDVYDKIYGETNNDAKRDAESSFIHLPASGVHNEAFQLETSMRKVPLSSSQRQPRLFVKKQLPLWRMICMMWCSPITKFYTSQLFYYFYLIILSISTLYPDQGNYTIDLIVCLWTFLTTISQIRQTYVIFLKFSSISLYYRMCEIIFIATFTILLTLTRVFHLHLYPVYTQKIINSMALVYFYYRFIPTYLPISSTLGPLLYRFSLMVSVDFVNYLRIVSVIIMSNAIVMNALEFPWKQFSWDTCSKVLHDGILTLFYGPPRQITVFASDPGAQNGSVTSTETFHSSLPIYMFVFQYFIILKLIIGALLFAIFSATASKWCHDIDNIWKFQRYLLVIDFANRLALPEPLSLFYYLYHLGHYLCFSLTWCTRSHSSTQQARRSVSVVSHNTIAPEDCLYWRELTSEYLDSQQQLEENETILRRSWEYTQEIAEELEYEKYLLREIKGKLFELEKNLSLKSESCQVKVDLARSSPYPGTRIVRFPVPRKYISWNVNYFAYEPVSYSRPIELFPLEVQSFVDQDFLARREESLRQLASPTAVLPRHSPFSRLRNRTNLSVDVPPRWNAIELEPRGILIDRRVWSDQETCAELSNEQAGEYGLEDDFLPLNPAGRTGLRGRGSLHRWAVNHYCFVIVAQHERGGIERVLCEHSLEHAGPQLIERFVNNKEEMYQQVFSSLFPDPDQPSVVRNWDSLRQRLENIFGDVWWCDVRLAQSGYLDDALNTDNAWKEGNVYLIRFGSIHLRHGGADAEKPLRTSVPSCLRNNKQLVWCSLTDEFCDNLPVVHSNLLGSLGLLRPAI